MTIAVTGATGQLGRLAIAKLLERGAKDVLALPRTLEKAADLGVPAQAADYTKPDTLDAALAGVDTLLLISSSEVGQRAAQHLNVIVAAKKAGVRHIVYTSLLHADTSPLDLAPEHLQTEDAIKASGLAFTILRNGWYTENYTGSVSGAVANGAFVGCAGEGKISSATREDLAEAAAVVLTGEGHEGKVYELGGDEDWTLADLAAEISRQTGKDIPYSNLTEADYAAVLEKAGLPGSMAAAFAAYDSGAAQGALFDDSRGLSRLIGRATTPLSKAVAAALAR